MSILDQLAEAAGVYWGSGSGPDDFVARVCLTDVGDGTFALEYEAWSHTNGLQHAEVARIGRADTGVTLVATSDGSSDALTFREGEPGVFGSTGPERVGLVIGVNDDSLTFSWWWPDEGGGLREQSRAQVTAMRPIVALPHLPHPTGSGLPARPTPRAAAPTSQSTVTTPRATVTTASRLIPTAGANPSGDTTAVPWPGIVVLSGSGTGVVAQRLAERLSRAAVVRTDLFDKAVCGTEAAVPDPALRTAIAVAVVSRYAAAGHPVILHGATTRNDHEHLVDELALAGLTPVRLVDVHDGEDYNEVARRLIEEP